jgi:uridine kinase
MRPHLVGIAGPSCSGKTQLASWLSKRTGAPILNLDHYYRDMAHLSMEVRTATNFDEPASLDHELIVEHICRLREGRTVSAPLYDFPKYTRAPGGEPIVPKTLVIVEGLFALYWPEVRSLLATKVFVEAPEDVCLARRLDRDVIERGRTRESVLHQFEATVRPMARLHILPTRAYADLVVSGTGGIQNNGERVLELLQHAQVL